MPPADAATPERARSSGKTASLALATCLLANFVYAAFSADRYGQSWDDPGDAAYGRASLRAYGGSTGYLESGDRKYYGPVYLMGSALVVDLLTSIVPTWNPIDIRHVVNFLAYEIAIIAFYGIARRLVRPGPAVAASLLFAYQPVLFGHAFINQKDIPFLAAFLVAILLGLRLAASPSDVDSNTRPADVRKGLADGIREIGSGRRALYWIVAGLGIVLAVELLFGATALRGLQFLLAQAYRGEGWPPLSTLFHAVAQDSYKTPLAAYAERLNAIYGWMRLVGAGLVLLPAAVFSVMIARRGGADLRDLRNRAGSILLASVSVGIAAAIRVVGLFAGGLVALAVLLERGRKALVTLAVYSLLAVAATYLFWPFLWSSPWRQLAEAASVMARFPDHVVLFRGQAISSGNLPWDYLPTMLSIQLTEPALLLAVLGVLTLFLMRRELAGRRTVLTVAAVWFLVPLAASLFLRTPLYSGFRQLLFALPPLFLMAALGLEQIWRWVENRLVRAVLALAVIAPGLAGIAGLRPYEYIYFNSLVGGVAGADGLYAHDYWCTSYREAMTYLNATAAPGARVAIAEPFQVAAPFARPDLQLVRSREDPQAGYRLRCNNQGDFTSRTLGEFPGAFAITRSGVILSVVLPQSISAVGAP